MLTQFRNGMDAITTNVSKEFGGVTGPMATQAVHTRKEPVGDKPNAPIGNAVIPSSVEMIKWKVLLEDYNKQHKKWVEEIDPRIFNLL